MLKINSVNHAKELAKKHRYILINDDKSAYLCTRVDAEMMWHAYGQSDLLEPNWDDYEFWLDINEDIMPALDEHIEELIE